MQIIDIKNIYRVLITLSQFTKKLILCKNNGKYFYSFFFNNPVYLHNQYFPTLLSYIWKMKEDMHLYETLVSLGNNKTHV